MRLFLLSLLFPLLHASIDPIKAEACITLSNDFILKDPEVGQTIANSKLPQHDTLKRLSVDVLIYCYNHIGADLALKVLAGEVKWDGVQAKQVCRYRKSLFLSENSEVEVSEAQRKHSEAILEAVKLHKKRRAKPQVAEL